MGAILGVAAMELRRTAGRYVVPALAAVAFAAAMGMLVQSQMPSCRCGG